MNKAIGNEGRDISFLIARPLPCNHDNQQSKSAIPKEAAPFIKCPTPVKVTDKLEKEIAMSQHQGALDCSCLASDATCRKSLAGRNESHTPLSCHTNASLLDRLPVPRGRRDESLERMGSQVAGESDGSYARLSIIMRTTCIAPTFIRQVTNIRARKGSQRMEFLQVCGYQ